MSMRQRANGSATSRILGLVTATHDTGVAVIENGVPSIVIEEERLNRHKRTQKFPKRALVEALRDLKLTLADIDVITTPWDQNRLRATFFKALAGRLPMSLVFLNQKAHGPQRHDIVLLNYYLARGIRKHLHVKRLPPIVNVGHHDSHAAMFFVSPFERASVLVMDGFGDDASTSAYTGENTKLERRWRTSIFNSLGIVYTIVTGYLGFGAFSDEGKVMGLAAYGGPTFVEKFRDVIRLGPDGTYAVNMEYFSFDSFGQLRPLKRKFYDKFGPARQPGEALEDRHRDVAFALQAVTEETILHMVRHIARTAPTRNLVLSGGVALNCVANARILAETDIERLWVPPCPSDTGAPLGSTLYHYHQTLGHRRGFEIKHASYGLEFDDRSILAALSRAGLKAERLSPDEIIRRTAQDLADGRIVGWLQGRFEMGPRALGNRSILADPRRAAMKDLLNSRVKHREDFRPFAPAVLEERAAEFFEIDQPDPFMTLAPRVRPDKRHLIPAAIHVDGTGRIQTVARAANPRYYDLIEAFGELTGVPVLLNTSFNRQEPIIARPEEAISCFLRTDMDVLVMGDYYTRDRNPNATAHANGAFVASKGAAMDWDGQEAVREDGQQAAAKEQIPGLARQAPPVAAGR